MRKTIVLAAFAAALAGVMAGCARQNHDRFQTFSPVAGLDGAGLYDRILTALRGTSQDRLAAGARMTAELQGSIVDCMRAADFDYTPAPYERTAGGPQTPGDLTTLAPIGEGNFGLAEFQRGVAEATDKTINPGYTTLTTDQQRADYNRAASACGNAAPQPREFRPDGEVKLIGELEQMFLAIEARPDITALRAEYGTCLQAAGFDATDHLSLFLLVQSKFPLSTTGGAEMSTTKQWATAVAYEQRAASVDATCRVELRETAMAIAAPQLAQFAATHAAELQRASDQWAARRLLP
ncbi:hypothetical protein AB0B31_11180 [Catellatospora citrea]|uniref:hypothetical protein n=1 Tax=Catellatospora citrea TaxID=53366 RepID=UPI0033C33B43